MVLLLTMWWAGLTQRHHGMFLLSSLMWQQVKGAEMDLTLGFMKRNYQNRRWNLEIRRSYNLHLTLYPLVGLKRQSQVTLSLQGFMPVETLVRHFFAILPIALMFRSSLLSLAAIWKSRPRRIQTLQGWYNPTSLPPQWKHIQNMVIRWVTGYVDYQGISCPTRHERGLVMQ